jgi:hypothetical protein
MASWSFAGNLQGPAGPTAVSADAGNSARLGTDGRVFVPASLSVLPVATATVLGGIKVGAGLTMTVDGVLSAAMATTYVNKAGDVMNGPLRWANSGSVSTFNGRDVYLYYDGTFFRCQLPSARSAWRIENNTGQVTFGSCPAAANPPIATSDLANKGYVDSRLSAVFDELGALKADVAALKAVS